MELLNVSRRCRQRWCRAATVVLLLILGAGSAAAEHRVRVVSQTVGGDEMLIALAQPHQIAALSHLAAEPVFSAVAEEARAYPRLSAADDAESILAHRPTLVLFADYSRAELVAQIRRTHVKVIVFDRYKTLADAYANLRLLARELDAEAHAESIIASSEARVKALRDKLAGVTPVRVIAPSTYGVVPGADTTFQDLCDHAGAENLAATIGGLKGHAPPPPERMLTWPIERVVVAGTNLDEALLPLRQIPPYQFMPAVKEGRAALIEPYQLSSVTHFRIDGYEQLARELHPGVFTP